MRKHFLAASLALGLLGVVPTAFAQQASTVTSAQLATVAGIEAQYPNGGTALAAAITAAVEADPSLAAAVAQAANNATPAQQTAMGTGLADAANYFASLPGGANTTAVQEIVAAIEAGPATLIAAANVEISAAAAGGGNNGGSTTAGSFASGSSNQQQAQQSCVSPSRPGPC